jgi:hypothetical protein
VRVRLAAAALAVEPDDLAAAITGLEAVEKEARERGWARLLAEAGLARARALRASGRAADAPTLTAAVARDARAAGLVRLARLAASGR